MEILEFSWFSESFVEELAQGVSRNQIFVGGKLAKAALIMEEVQLHDSS